MAPALPCAHTHGQTQGHVLVCDFLPDAVQGVTTSWAPTTAPTKTRVKALSETPDLDTCTGNG